MTDSQPKDPQRSECRLNHPFTVYLETHSSYQGEQQPTALVITKTVDVSANGIQIILDHGLPLQSILQFCLESSDSDDEAPFMLTGEVAWLRAQDQQTLTGFRLLESDDTDIIRWKEYIARCLLAE